MECRDGAFVIARYVTTLYLSPTLACPKFPHHIQIWIVIKVRVPSVFATTFIPDSIPPDNKAAVAAHMSHNNFVRRNLICTQGDFDQSEIYSALSPSLFPLSISALVMGVWLVPPGALTIHLHFIIESERGKTYFLSTMCAHHTHNFVPIHFDNKIDGTRGNVSKIHLILQPDDGGTRWKINSGPRGRRRAETGGRGREAIQGHGFLLGCDK